MSNYKLESMVNEDGIVMMQLKGEDHVIGFASFALDVAKDFIGSMLILKDKLEAAGMVKVSDVDTMPVPATGARVWN